MSQTTQQKVVTFVARHDLQTTREARLLDLVSEIGELAKEALKSSDYGRQPAARAGTAWQQEMGDVYFALLCLANETTVDLDEVLEAVLAKYEARLARTQDAGSGR